MTTGVQQAAQPWREDPRPARRVLLVDDYDTVRQLLRCILEQGGYQVIEARNGAEALTLCRLEEPDLEKLDELFEILEFRSLRERVGVQETTQLGR